MNPNLKAVKYSFECGDIYLPHLSALVSDIEDNYKSIIIDYLKENIIATCPGTKLDIIDNSKSSGCGNLFSDDTFLWDDCLFYYVKNYNIPIPDEFREHILKNYKQRKSLHTKCRLLDSISIYNNPYLGYRYNINIDKNGNIIYKNNLNCIDAAFFSINKDDARYIVRHIIQPFFCYDIDNKGKTIIDGHNWSIQFYDNTGLSYSTEGHNNEPTWRYQDFKNILIFIEEVTKKDIGTKYMDI